jgi:PAS domain-containing protein
MNREAQPGRNADPHSGADIEHADGLRQTVDTLQARLAELELQNKELRDAQDHSEQLQRIYGELYEGSPLAHVVLDTSGFILRANRAAGDLLDTPTRALLRQPFHAYIVPDPDCDYRDYCREAIVARRRSSCEAVLQRLSGSRVRVRLSIIGMCDPETGQLVCHVALAAIGDPHDGKTGEVEVPGQPNAEAPAEIRQLAHDISDALAGVKNVLFLLKGAVPPEHPFSRYLPLAEDRIQYVASILHRASGWDLPPGTKP